MRSISPPFTPFSNAGRVRSKRSPFVMHFLAQQTPPPDDIYDIVVLAPKDPVWPIYLGAVLLLLVLVAIGLAIWWWRRRSGNKGAALSPEQRVGKRLLELQQTQSSLDPNKFSLELSEALKDYLAEKFDDPIRYETAQEFLNRVSRERSKMPEAAQQELQQFLLAGEELKFGNTEGAKSRTSPLFEAANRIVTLCQAIGGDSGGASKT